jgi:hypothetical protein
MRKQTFVALPASFLCRILRQKTNDVCGQQAARQSHGNRWDERSLSDDILGVLVVAQSEDLKIKQLE